MSYKNCLIEQVFNWLFCAHILKMAGLMLQTNNNGQCKLHAVTVFMFPPAV